MSDKKTCTSVDEVIRAFGRPVDFAKRFNRRPNVVANWKKAGRFPDMASLHFTITKALKRKGLKVDPALFGIGIDNQSKGR